MKKLRYPCLVVDHDDTAVNSTATIHYPCFVQYIREFYPNAKNYTLEEYFIKNFDPGIVEFFCGEIGMDAAAMRHEEAYWRDYVETHIPEAYPGMKRLLCEQKARGGKVCVVSHSFADNILRDWKTNDLPEPDLIFGWEQPPEKRKPRPYPLQEIMRHFGFHADKLLMLDDLKPGYDMAKACGVKFAAAGWANDIPEIEAFMRKNCDFYCKTIDILYQYLFED